jgi:hypothetical protein
LKNLFNDLGGGGGILRLGKAFLGLVVSKTGHTFAPALGGLFLSSGFRGVKTMILETPMGAISISIDNVNSVKGVGDRMCPCTTTIILMDLGPTFGGGGASTGAAKFLRSNHVNLHDEVFQIINV